MRTSKYFKQEKGSVVILVAIALGAILLGIAALVIDMGNGYLKKNRMQTAVDAAALAGARTLYDNPSNQAAALNKAIAVAKDNGFTITAANVKFNGSKVSVDINEDIATLFARIFSINAQKVKSHAAADVQYASSVSGLVPFGILKDDFVPGATYTLKNSAGEGDTGWYGALSITRSSGTDRIDANHDGYPELINKGSGANDYRDNLTNGTIDDLTININDYIFYKNGNMSGPTRQALEDRLADTSTYNNYAPGCTRLVLVPIIVPATSAMNVPNTKENLALNKLGYRFAALLSGFSNYIVPTAEAKQGIATPTFNIKEGTYEDIQTLTMSTSTSAATIRYTLDGSIPTSTHGSIYSGPLTLSATTTVKAIAYKSLGSSGVISATYIITLPQNVATPYFNPPGGSYYGTQNVSITTGTSGASIRYTMDGSIPTNSHGTLYTGPIPIYDTISTTIKAIAYRTGINDSAVATANYKVIPLPDPVVAPTFSPDPGTYTVPQTISISCATSGATIRYTTDGSDPTPTTGTVYAYSFIVSSTTLVKAIAYKDGMANSSVTGGTYYVIPDTASPIEGNGSDKVARVVGFAAFFLETLGGNGNNSYVTGRFVKYIDAQHIKDTTTDSYEDYNLGKVVLVE